MLHQLGIPRDIYKVERRFRAKDIIIYSLSFLRAYCYIEFCYQPYALI